METLIVPAVIAKQQSEIDRMLSRVKNKVNRIMVDVMDGEFVPNTSLMFDFKLPAGFEYEAHLMMNEPLEWIKENEGKVDIAIIHVESLEDIKYAIEDAKRMGVRVYLAMRPQTGIDAVLPYLREVDGILEMTADPGTYCTEFLIDTLDKVKQLREVDKSIPIEVDGCMNPKNAKLAKEAGANLFVSGSHIFKSPNVDVALKELEDAIK